MSEKESPQTARMLMLLLCLQLVFLGALYLKLNAIHGNLLGLYRDTSSGSGMETVVAEVTAGHGPSKGAPEAAVEILEFSDFSCGACREAQPVLRELLERNGDSLRLVYRHFPLRPDGPPFNAAVAAECAFAQGAFWPMHDRLFEGEGPFPREALEALGRELGLDGDEYRRCLEGPDSAARVREDRAAGLRWGVSGTPTLFINGRRVTGVPGLAVLQDLVDEIRREDPITPAGG